VEPSGTETAGRGAGLLSRWVILPAALFAALAFVALLQGLSAAPSGVDARLDLAGLVLPRLRGDLLVASLLAVASQAPLLALPRSARRTAGGLLFLALGAASIFVLLAAVVDAQFFRYSSGRLDLFMLTDYRMERDPAFTGRILLADSVFLGPAMVTFLLFALAVVGLARRPGEEMPSRRCVLGSLLVLVASLAGFTVLPVPAENWRQAEPSAWRLSAQAVLPSGRSGIPEGISGSVSALQDFLGKPLYWFGSSLYPLWHDVPDEEASYARFRSLPAAQKPDILLVVFESLRGWEADFGDPASAARFPTLHGLFEERGRDFVRFQSNGYPSVEGWASLSLGLWAHPSHLLLAQDLDKRLVSLPEILGRAGYWKAIISPEPWGNMSSWYARWYDEVSLDVRRTDEEMAHRLLALYDAAPQGRPRLLTWITVSTHPPFLPPPGAAYPGEPGSRQQYLAAAAETDRVLDVILEHIRAAGRWDRTLVVVTGDHSTSNGWIALNTPHLGTPNAGETWTPLFWAPPGGPGGVVDQRVGSQVDLAPTLLGYLGLDVSNHFMGRNLLDVAAKRVPAVSLHLGGVAVTRGNIRFHFRLEDPSIIRKFLWDVSNPETTKDGSYRHGMELPLRSSDRDEMAQIGRLVSAYGYLVSADRIIPPKAFRAWRTGEQRGRNRDRD